MKKFLVALLLLIAGLSYAQHLTITGNVQDTTAKGPLPNALTMVVRLADSTLIKYGRSDVNGIFKLEGIPIDTYIVVISHPSFADQTAILVGSGRQKMIDFGKIILPPKSNTLNEVTVYGYADKVYYKGDTLVFTADSFKTKANATVEDLLRKLPGVKVDAAGKIKVQGKEVSQVLVDGDEFFGSDPTVATRNLNANTIESVQVYEKKAESSESKEETVSILNLKMKDEAKKGYFGKVSGAGGVGGTTPFYESELLANRFHNKRKFSLFGLGANSPRQRFNWDDIFQYGLDNEMNRQENEDGDMVWYSDNDNQGGIPRTLKTGFYFSDQLFKKTKLNMDYTFSQNDLNTVGSTNTQYFLTDTTYSNSQLNTGHQNNQVHASNFRITQKLDSLTELTITPKIKYALGATSSSQVNDFISEEGVLTRQTDVSNRMNSEALDLTSGFRLNRKFKKKERNLLFNYILTVHQEENTGYLSSRSDVFGQNPSSTVIDQKKTSEYNKTQHEFALTYTEPLSLKLKLEVSYDFNHNLMLQNKKTQDFSGTAFDVENPLLTNDFKNLRMVHRAGTRLIYEVKKYRFAIGSKFRQVDQSSLNLTTNSKLSQTVYNVLPLLQFRYRFSQSKSFSIDYNTSSRQPDLNQLQPIINNTDPNRISLGNPDLKPTFQQDINMNFYSWKAVSGRNFYGGLYGSMSNIDIVYNTSYDSLGVATTQPVNINNGKYNMGSWLGFNYPLFKRLLELSTNVNSNYFSGVSFINSVKNVRSEYSLGPQMDISHDGDIFSFEVGGNYNYNLPSATISNQSNQPFSSYGLRGEVQFKIKKTLTISTDAKYTNNSQRTDGYNLSFVIWNASISKTFLKRENLIVSLNAYDLLNQNISTQRNIMDNRIIDVKSQVIQQYFLLKVLFKFNSNKEKEEEDD